MRLYGTNIGGHTQVIAITGIQGEVTVSTKDAYVLTAGVLATLFLLVLV